MQLEVNFFRRVACLPGGASGHAPARIGLHRQYRIHLEACFAIPYQGLYSASKFALEGIRRKSLRVEVKDFGIRVVIVSPATTKHHSPKTGA